ncbi:hypothetical protein OAF51_01625 [Akkermansiaceae bacterium]|nr:hypothetical protein [Akkermansiaceae bacterium]
MDVEILNLDRQFSGEHNGLAPGMHVEVAEGQIYTVQRVCLDDEQCHAAAKYSLISLLESTETMLEDAKNGKPQNFFSTDAEEDKVAIQKHVDALNLIAGFWFGHRDEYKDGVNIK